ncbi:MAG: DNA methyltransferase [Roseiflexaceae bacterium]|nr:DNA methyltransferase [Roseiflexaceae bacterium]
MLALDSDGMAILERVSALDWSAIEPSIFGTLFERSLDPSKRSQLGAHYTSRDDIMLIIEPVLMAPLRRRWAEVQAQARAVAVQRDAATGSRRTRLENDLIRLLMAFVDEIVGTRVLDPACGSGNFLYVALKQLLDLEKEVITLGADLGLTRMIPVVSPEQLYGIEVNEYAHELAQITVWIGYLQWLRDNGFGKQSEPILQSLDTIKRMDAILAFDEQGQPYEPEWPAADVVIGNPPFLGDKKMRGELGDSYVEALRKLYEGRVPGGADLVTYWFEGARALIEHNQVKRAGLLATNSIRGGANRKILERIKHSGDIFMAWDDRSWILDGAAVRVSIIGFDGGTEHERELNKLPVSEIYSNLTGSLDAGSAKRLIENQGLSLLGTFKIGSFDILRSLADTMIGQPLNPNGRPNSDVVLPWVNGLDITRRPRDMWIINFRDLPEAESALYKMPFDYIYRIVKPERDENRRPRRKQFWWQHGETSPSLYTVLDPLPRFIGTPRLSKHRLFVWLKNPTLPDCQIVVFGRSDDYFLGVLHSKIHEVWSLRMGTSLEDRPRYTPTTCFETFPFPWAPGTEDQADLRVIAIAAAAKRLVELRDAWLNPPGLSDAELKKRTLTNLYNARPEWLAEAHAQLDRAVCDAYGWPHDLSDEQILERLLALNLERAAMGGVVGKVAEADEEEG